MCSPIRPGGLKGREAGEGMDLKARLWVGGAAAGEGGEREKRKQVPSDRFLRPPPPRRINASFTELVNHQFSGESKAA